jgi:hypothetical protein
MPMSEKEFCKTLMAKKKLLKGFYMSKNIKEAEKVFDVPRP